MAQTILVSDMIDEVRENWIDMPRKAEVKSKINSIIHRMNSIITAREAIILITGSAGTWEEIDTAWEDLTENWETLDRFVNGFDYDSDDNALIVPTDIIKIMELWVDDNLWHQRSYEYVKDLSEFSHVYCQIGNKI